MNTQILLVEDESAISEPLAFLLSREGYTVTVVSDGKEAIHAFNNAEEELDLILLDLMLPGLPGTEVCRAIRATSSVPIIMLTAKDTEVDIVVGLELGADDYITKPYSSRELLARVRAVLRRKDVPESSEVDQEKILDINQIRLDSSRYTLKVRGQEITIPLREFELLEYLMQNAGRVLTRDQLISHVWGSNYFGDTKTLDVHIKRIRSRIEEDPSNPELVTTIRGVGYRFA